ncbi:MAG: HAD family hydrolase [Patescibacteria group bacterium]
MILFLDFDRTLFNNERFYNALEFGLIFSEKAVVVDNLGEYLYEDTIDFLKKRKSLGDKLVLVTRGNLIVQKTKAEKTSVLGLVDHDIYVEKPKSKGEAISEYIQESELDSEKMVFVDDTIAELEDVMNTCNNVSVIRMRRRSARNAGQEALHLTEVANFEELDRIL